VAIEKFKDNSSNHIEGVSKNSFDGVGGVSPDFTDRLSKRFIISLEGVQKSTVLDTTLMIISKS
jgi:hypothetical protein